MFGRGRWRACETPEERRKDKDWDCVTWRNLDYSRVVIRCANMFFNEGEQASVNLAGVEGGEALGEGYDQRKLETVTNRFIVLCFL